MRFIKLQVNFTDPNYDGDINMIILISLIDFESTNFNHGIR